MERDNRQGEGSNAEREARRSEHRIQRAFITYLAEKSLDQEETARRVEEQIRTTGTCELSLTLQRLDRIASTKKRLKEADRQKMKKLMGELDLHVGFQHIERIYGLWKTAKDKKEKTSP